jgi:nucleoside-diphosphate-sugar epimerase
MPKRILITGASGFIGANLARRALRDGHEVHLLLRSAHRPWRIEDIAGDVRSHVVDMVDRGAVSAAVRAIRPDRIFHLAAYGAYSSQQGMDRMVSTNLSGCVALLDACAEAGFESFVNAGSSSEYGIKNHAPDEDEAADPNSHYAITKLAATNYCRFAARTRDLNAVTVRLYSVYGPWEEPTRLIPTLIGEGLKGKLPPLVSPAIARDFVYVDDAVDAMMRIADSGPQRGSVYNVCSGVQTNLREVVEIARRLMDVREEPAWATMPDRAWDTDVWVGSGARLEKELGWRATTGFAQGLQRTIDWYCAYYSRNR